MKDYSSDELLQKYNKGLCTDYEKAVIETWFLEWEEGKPLSEEQFERINQDVWESILQTKLRTKKINWPLRIASIAAVIVFLMFIIFFIPKKFPSKSENTVTDINPGTNKARLQLANGKIINLSNTKTGVVINGESIKYSDGEIVATQNIGIQMISTPNGGQYQVELPDGTQVWLNANSKISFPSQFSGKERKILLSGEAYFEVTKDKKRPFIVATNQQTIQVLGTHFNISAYSEDKSTTTTLLEGSVRVSPKEHHPGADRDGVVLKPNQQSILSPFGEDGVARGGSAIKVIQVDPGDAIAWKNGEFAFNNEPLSSIMPRLARWYDVEISYQNNEIKNKRLNGTISRFGKISEILSMLEITGEVHFKIEERRITVMP